MSFWSSDRDPVAAASVLRDVGRALSELDLEGLVKEHTAFLDILKRLLEAVQKIMKRGLFPHSLQDDIAAIWKSLLNTEVEMVSSMGLNESEVKTEDMKSVTSKFYMKIAYYERFSSKMIALRKEVAVPLSRLHSGVTMIFSQNPSRSWEAIERWTAESKRYTENGLVHQIKEWLRPKSEVQDIYHAYTNTVLSPDCDWFLSKKEYVDWSTKSVRGGNRILWISEILGVRRTQVAARVIEKLREDERTVAYFFSKETFSKGDVRSVIATLCLQLLTQFPEDIGLLSEVFNKGCEPNEINIRGCLQRMCQKRHAIILLDGFDRRYYGSIQWDRLGLFLESLRSVCDIIVFDTVLQSIKWDLTCQGEIPLTVECADDFWKEMEKVPARYVAGLEASDEKMEQGVNAKIRAYEDIEEQDVHFPVTREDQYRVYAMIRDRASGSRLPAYVARQIIDQAEYWVKSTFERREPLETNAGEAKRNVPYLLSDPIDGASHLPVRKIIITCSHDEVWSEYPDKHGSYEGSDAYFDCVVRKSNGDIREPWSGRRHIYDAPLGMQPTFFRLNLIEPGDKLAILPKAIAPRWIDFVETVRIEIFSTFILEEKDGHDGVRGFEQRYTKLLARIKDARKQARLPTDKPKDVEQALPSTRFKRKSKLSNWNRQRVQSLEKQKRPLMPSTEKSLTYTESKLRSPRSSLSVYMPDQLGPTPFPTRREHSNEKIFFTVPDEQIPLDYTNHDDKNAHSSTWTTFIRMIRELVRPKVRPGYKRLEWTCTCGESLYGDFEEKTPGSLDRLAAQLKQRSGQSSQHGASAPIPQPKKAHTRQAQTVGYNMPGSGSSSSNDPNNLVSNAVSSQLNTVKPPLSTALQLCIETGKYKLEMSELARPSLTVSDGELFAKIREKYESTRHSILPTWARFKKPNRAIFVKFLLGTKRTVSLNYETPSIPPPTEVKHNYDYDPCPMEIPPMDSRVFFHHFYAPRSQHPDVFWGNRLPWKVKPLLGPSNHGWGIYLEESPDWPLFAALMCFLLLLSGVVAGIYAWKMDDAQTGVAIGAWLTSVQAMGITAVFFWWS